jgi:hypothetical protein
MEEIAPGTNRRSHYKTLKKLWRWWGVNNEVLSPELFQRFLRVLQGVEGPREGVEVTQQYKGLLAYFVLGGLQGLRTCEMVRERAKDPVIELRDFLWRKKLIVVRDEVAKQTRARDKLRYVPLEPTTIKLLKPLATTGRLFKRLHSASLTRRRSLWSLAHRPEAVAQSCFSR